MRTGIAVAVAVICVAAAVAQDAKPADDAKNKDAQPVTAAIAASPLDFTMADIDGKDVPLSKYKGKVVMMVNVASKCGMTPQYEQLEAIYEKYESKGLAIAGFPANEFGKQEPGSNEEIKAFCTKNYGVSFDMYSKIVVKGDETHELYKYLTSKKTNEEFAGEIQWNFTKFLIDRDGKVIARFGPRTKPDDAEVIKAIEDALAKGAG
jgi:glutathione peroxidase